MDELANTMKTIENLLDTLEKEVKLLKKNINSTVFSNQKTTLPFMNIKNMKNTTENKEVDDK